MNTTLNSFGAAVIVFLILVAAYCWIFGLVRSVYWYRRTRKKIKAGVEYKSNTHWLDRYLFGYFAILSNPEALTEDGLVARKKTIAAFKTFGVGVLLAILVIIIEAGLNIVEY